MVISGEMIVSERSRRASRRLASGRTISLAATVVRNLSSCYRKRNQVALSIGVGNMYPSASEKEQQLVKCADPFLYETNQSGRSRICY